eukprot:9901-Pelagomonas_calceolata.AAC.3
MLQKHSTHEAASLHLRSSQVKKGEMCKIHELVAALNPGARITEATHGDVPVKDITRTGAFDLDKVRVLGE